MNIERINALADLIEKQPHTKVKTSDGFTMSSLTHDCGTPACIAGWAAWESLGHPNTVDAPGYWGIENTAARWIGMDEINDADDGYELGNTYRLFFPDVDCLYDAITPAHAAATLRHLAETGKVDWSASRSSIKQEG